MSASQRIVLVTGASSGFGLAISRALAARGDVVYGSTRTPVEPEPGILPLALDVTSDDSVSRAVGDVIARHGRLDAVVNNAGIGVSGAIEDTTLAEAQRQMDTNFFGVHRVCRAVLPHLRSQGGGHIVNISSLGGLVPIPFQAFYSCSKFAIEAYTEALRMEVWPFGIRVSMVEPGDFATAMTSKRIMTAASTAASPYYARCTRAIAQMAYDEQRNKDISPVVNAVVKILSDPKPALRYPRATAVQRILVAARPFMPHAMFEYLMMETYGLR